jgi:valyl-tRNA synthetase
MEGVSESIVVSPFPVFDAEEVDEESEIKMDLIMGVVDVIRNIRGETGIAPNVKIEAIVRANGHTLLLKEYEFYIKELAKIEHLSFTADAAPEKAAIGTYKDVEIFVPIKDLIDVPVELVRIEKELSKIGVELERLFNKLNNASFRAKAPPEVIEKNELNYKTFQEKREKLVASRNILKSLSEG